MNKETEFDDVKTVMDLESIANSVPAPRPIVWAALVILAVVLGLGISGYAKAAGRPITIVVPFAAGGPTDRVARDLAVALAKPLGDRTVIIENVGGAGGTLGATKVARSAPDGNTLLLHHIGIAAAPALYRKLPYNTLEDFEYLGLFQEVPMTLVGGKALPPRFNELPAWIKLQPKGVSLAHAGYGSASHLCGLLLQTALKQQMVEVPYRGTGPAMNDVLAGQVDLMCDQTTNTSQHIAVGGVRGYAVTTAHRIQTPALAALPTSTELGLASMQITSWVGLYAPKGTPHAVLDQLNAALRLVVVDPVFVKNQEAAGARVINDDRLGPEAHKRFVMAEIDRWSPLIRATGAVAD